MKNMILKFDMQWGNSIRPATRIHYLRCLKIFAEGFKDKSPNQITKDDLVIFFNALSTNPRKKPNHKIEPMGARLIEQTKISVKKFFKEFYGTDEYPDLVKWIKVNKNTKPAVTREDLLTDVEIKKMVEVCDSARDRAFIMLLAESAARPEELLNMKIKNVKFGSNNIASIEVNAKTGYRKLPILNSVPSLREWINQHPNPTPESYLWVCIRKNYAKQISLGPMTARIKRLAKRAGITKSVYCYLFRHTQLTQLVKMGYSELYLKKHAGWSFGSSMAEVYIHLAFDDIEQKYLEVNGIAQVNDVKESALKTKKCPNCSEVNQATNKMCSKCSYIVDMTLKTAFEYEENRKQMDELMNMLMSRPNLKNALQEELAQIEKERRQKESNSETSNKRQN